MLSALLEKARADSPLWLPELREAFLRDPAARPVTLRLTLHDGSQRDYPCALPRWETEEEQRFAAEFFHACVYNILAACSGRELRLFFDRSDAELCALAAELDAVFQVREARRRGYGKVISIAGRIAASYGGPAFRFVCADLRELTPLPEPPEKAPVPLDETLRRLGEEAASLALCGIDVGGTDIKLAASDGGRLVCVKEYDWNPAAYGTAEEITEPILLLTRLMRCCLAAGRGVCPEPVRDTLAAALDKDAPLPLIRGAVEAAEACFGAAVDVLDGVGLSFPDIVIDDRILGGETPKTDGMRRNPALDYEVAFRKLSGLKGALTALCRAGGRVHITNDGNMAAFTAAMEIAHSGEAQTLREGVLAHSLGTDLGTGWLMADGTIPALPLEMYDLILDLGSFPSRAFAPADLRSTRNQNSGLPGALRYMGQAAAYRLAQKLGPGLLDGFTEDADGVLRIITAPQDLRKPCLESLMQKAETGDTAACEIFRCIGTNLSVVTREMEYLLHPGATARYLFGRFVKRPGVFALLDAGFRAGAPGLRLVPSDGGLANTPLMHALSTAPGVTVAQFGQAVGAIYFALT